jgi:hypothetical protein
MGLNDEIKNKSCVLVNCNRKAVSFCNNCRIPVCDIHSKKIDRDIYVCTNCFEFIRKMKLR